MHIIVCVKQVPDTTQVKVSPETNTLIREGIPSIINPFDLHAIEAAVSLKEAYGGWITALTMGPPQAEDALKETISFGADAAVLVSDRAYAGSDTLATSYILSAAIEKISSGQPVNLIICGKQSIDGDTAQVGPGIAKRLNFTQLTYVRKIREINTDEGTILVERHLESGIQIVKGNLPVLVTVEKEIGEVGYAPLPNLIKAAKFKPHLFNQANLNLDKAKIGLKGSPTQVRKIFAPDPPAGGEIIADQNVEPKKAAAILADKLISLDFLKKDKEGADA